MRRKIDKHAAARYFHERNLAPESLHDQGYFYINELLSESECVEIMKRALSIIEKTYHDASLVFTPIFNGDKKRLQVYSKDILDEVVSDFEERVKAGAKLPIEAKHNDDSLLASLPGCYDQKVHCDYRWETGIFKGNKVPGGILVAIEDDTYILGCPTSMQTTMSTIKKHHLVSMWIPKGCGLFFRGDWLHAGHGFLKSNIRIHSNFELAPDGLIPRDDEGYITVDMNLPDSYDEDEAEQVGAADAADATGATGAAGADRCTNCNTTKFVQWRKGPNGLKTFCNACGVVWSRTKQLRVLDLPDSCDEDEAEQVGAADAAGSEEEENAVGGDTPSPPSSPDSANSDELAPPPGAGDAAAESEEEENAVGGDTPSPPSSPDSVHSDELASPPGAAGAGPGAAGPGPGAGPGAASDAGADRCTNCNTTKFVQWRKGPNGLKTFCNACGVVWSRTKQLRVLDSIPS
jgi:hypothetical protein